jgi:hypothetical protein
LRKEYENMVHLLTVNDIGGNHGLGVTTMVLAIEADEGVNVREASELPPPKLTF